MYILSQDKSQLINLDNFVLTAVHNHIMADRDIISTISEIKHRSIAKYDSDERAKEVLQEIVNFMKPYIAFHNLETDDAVLDNIRLLGFNEPVIQVVSNNEPKVEFINCQVYELPEK